MRTNSQSVETGYRPMSYLYVRGRVKCCYFFLSKQKQVVSSEEHVYIGVFLLVPGGSNKLIGYNVVAGTTRHVPNKAASMRATSEGDTLTWTLHDARGRCAARLPLHQARRSYCKERLKSFFFSSPPCSVCCGTAARLAPLTSPNYRSPQSACRPPKTELNAIQRDADGRVSHVQV